MSRVTDFPEDEPRPLREGRGKDDDEGSGGEGRAISVPRIGGGKLGRFYHDVKLEMRKTTWPTRSEVWSTTVVVLIAVVFFGFYLWGVDWLVTRGFEYLQKALG